MSSLIFLSDLFPYALKKMKLPDCELDNLNSNSTNIMYIVPMFRAEMQALELIISLEKLQKDHAYWNKSRNIFLIASFSTTVKYYIIQDNGEHVQQVTTDSFDTELAKEEKERS
jgi:hypothetical protein